MSNSEDPSQPMRPDPSSGLSRLRQTTWADHKSTSDGDILYDDPGTKNRSDARGQGASTPTMDGHVRSLSGRFLDATKLNISPDNSVTYSPDPSVEGVSEKRDEAYQHYQQQQQEPEPFPYPTQQAKLVYNDSSALVGKKHKRGLSAGKTHPVMAHRRINSGGEGTFIQRQHDNVNHRHEQHPHVNISSGHPRSHGQTYRESYNRGGSGTGADGGTEHHSSSHWTQNKMGPPHHHPPPISENRHHGYSSSRNSSRSRGDRSSSASPSGYYSSYGRQEHQQHQHEYPHYSKPPPQSSHHSENLHRHPSPLNGPPVHGGGHRYESQGQGQAHDRFPRHRQHHPVPYPDDTRSNQYLPHHNNYPRSRPLHNTYYPLPRSNFSSSTTSPNNSPKYPLQYPNDASGFSGTRRFTPPPTRPSGHHHHSPHSYDNRAPPPPHPLVGSLAPNHYPGPIRQTSQSSLGSDTSRIETDEHLFANKQFPDHATTTSNGDDVASRERYIPQQDFRSSPQYRFSPKLFEETLNGLQRDEHGGPRISSSPPDNLLSASLGSYGSEIISHQHHRQSSSLSSPQMKKFINDVEKSQGHERTSSTGSFVLDDNLLFGEKLLLETDFDTPPNAYHQEIGPSRTSAGQVIHENPSSKSLSALPPPPSISIPMSQSFPPTSSSQTVKFPSQEAKKSPIVSTTPTSTSTSSTPTNRKERKINASVSKRARRKCTVADCTNRVVQGGLCIAHGAKRKTCGHPGCTKHVKKAGMCSAHGPPRKLCEFKGCKKVSVQGGKCIAHGAKKKLCSVDKCKKQAILGGMCKKHHDEQEHQNAICLPVGSGGEGNHQRGLSVFDDLAAVEQMVNLRRDENGNQSTPRSSHNRGLSIFADNGVADKIIEKSIDI